MSAEEISKLYHFIVFRVVVGIFGCCDVKVVVAAVIVVVISPPPNRLTD